MSVNIDRAKARNQLEALIARYGADATLAQVLAGLPEPSGFKCPQCNGVGTHMVRVPTAWPNEYEAPHYESRTCDVCKGEGYTPRELRPVMVQQGWQ